MSRLPALLTLLSAVLCCSVPAAEIDSFSPQGQVKAVRQVTVRFSEPMVAFGDPQRADPFNVSCTEPGQGRWIDGRNWSFDYKRDLPAGVSCTFSLVNTLRTLQGNSIEGLTSFSFNTGGPNVQGTLPFANGYADEEQIFIVKLDVEADDNSMQERVRCEIEGINEQVGIRLVGGVERKKILDEMRNRIRAQFFPETAATADSQLGVTGEFGSDIVLLQCKRNFPNNAKVKLVWGKGVQARSEIATDQDQTINFTVRDKFEAKFSCDRVNAAAACVPILPMTVYFSAPISAREAAKIVLRTADGKSISPSGLEKQKRDSVGSVNFVGPFPEKAVFTLQLPANLSDDAERRLANADQFPLKVETDDYPPLAKFPARFGIIESSPTAALPVTLRNIEAMVKARMLRAGTTEEALDSASDSDVRKDAQKETNDSVRKLANFVSKFVSGEMPGRVHRVVQRDEDVLDWMARLGGMDEWGMSRSESIFSTKDKPTRFSVPKPLGGKEFEVVGIPLKKPGFYIVELESPKLGAALLEEKKSMFVQTAVLVTNLAAHLKWGRESSLVWVTTLDKAAPVANAAVTVRDCHGALLWQGVTNDSGLAFVHGLPAHDDDSVRGCSYSVQGLFVSARTKNDMTFVFSNWDEGIRPWQFGLPIGQHRQPYVAHSVLARSLLRAGETLHMKHFYRKHTMGGFSFADKAALPSKLLIIHHGSEQAYEVPVMWTSEGTAETHWKIPEDAKFGTYNFWLTSSASSTAPCCDGDAVEFFRVEAFRVPTMRATIQGPRQPLVNATEAPLDLLVSYMSGGGARNANVKLRSQIRPRTVRFSDYSEYHFSGGDVVEGLERNTNMYGGYGYDESEGVDSEEGSSPVRTTETRVAQTIPLTLDAAGAARTKIEGLPRITAPHEILTELEFQDANGEIATVSQQIPLWPAKLNLGLRTDGWAATKDKLRFSVIALDLVNKPAANITVTVDLFKRVVYSHRKRLLGGFYSYENVTETKQLGEVCGGTTNAQGVVYCDIKPPSTGEVLLRAKAVDDVNNTAVASSSVWVVGDDEWWFGAADNDRMDVLPEKKRYEPGDVARFQVRMPFREATALITVEREGIVDTYVRKLSGKSPIVEIPIKNQYAPNVYVSVLALRGRVGGVQPTALVDLGKPAFKLGIGRVSVGWRPHELKVTVKTPQSTYRVRESIPVTVSVKTASGLPLPKGSEVAVAVVDEALLELMGNPSLKLLDAMMVPRGIEVFTSTAQMQVVGKRHFGKKSVAPGGSGGRMVARELFDTLLLWKANVVLNAKGEALVNLPLNDALTSFRIVAVANGGTGYFGTGESTVRTNQDVMLLSGLPPLVRQGDRFQALVNIRNATNRSIEANVKAKLAYMSKADAEKTRLHALDTINTTLLPGEAKEISWSITVPANSDLLRWEVVAEDSAGMKLDFLKVSQNVVAAHPVRVLQATLAQLDQTLTMPIELPHDAIEGRGDVSVVFRARLGEELAGVKDYMATYPYSCLEQQVSRAVSMKDANMWMAVANKLPAYLDDAGLARYFASERLSGSDVLTSYILSISDEADWKIPETSLAKMKTALSRFVAGNLNPETGWRTADLAVRKLAAIAALSHYSAADPTMLGSFSIEPNQWPTSALLDWLEILKRVKGIEQQEQYIAQAKHILRSRINLQGTRMGFSNEKGDALWWLMISADVNSVRSIIALLDDTEWHEDIPRLVRGALGRQTRGHWDTTTANAWGTLALAKFSTKFESAAVTGATSVRLADNEGKIDWAKAPQGGHIKLGWPSSNGSIEMQHSGEGKPWALIQSRAAVARTEPASSGYEIKRTITPTEQKRAGEWSRGDVYRITLELTAQSDMTWVVVDDPIPSGSTILGSGLGRDSRISSQGEKRSGWTWPAYEERTLASFRAYYDYVPKGKWKFEYTVRLNNSGTFDLPSTRVEAMYAPEMFGEIPNQKMVVGMPVASAN